MKIAANIFIVFAIAILSYLILSESKIELPPGQWAPDQPYQKNLTDNRGWIKEGYLITALAEFKLEAKILSMERYYFDSPSTVSPIDLALGWGALSDQSIVDKINVRQGRRWYWWDANPLPLPKNVISDNTSNMHIIPADDTVESTLDEISTGNIIGIEGYLVRVTGPDGFVWSSSLSRTDRGDGACEIVYVTLLNILK